MPDVVAPYYVLPDANIWIAERLLQSAIGSAFLYSVTRAKSSILLPEVVELEVGQVLPKKAEEGVSAIKRELSLLQQLSGHDLRVDAPSQLARTRSVPEWAMICILAERPGTSAEDLIKWSQHAIAEFTQHAIAERAAQRSPGPTT
jgi:hypothetical protein